MNDTASAPGPAPASKSRLKPGERRTQILQVLAAMLQEPGTERITTAALAARLQVSEAALYRHFASKAKMFEALLDFIEQSVLGLVQQIAGDDAVLGTLGAQEGRVRAARIVALLLQFAEKNPGMVRVMVGDALLGEHERLQLRMQQFFERIESILRQCLRAAAGGLGSSTPTVEAQVAASVLMSFVQGRLLRFVRTAFRRQPTDHLDASPARLI